MTLNKTAIAAVLSLAALTGFGGVAMAQSETAPQPVMNGQPMMGHNGMKQGQGYHRGFMANLTPEQQATSQKIFNEFQTKSADLRQKMMSKNYEYKALLTSNPLDEQKVQAVSKEIDELRNALHQNRVAMDIEMAKAGMPMTGRHMGMGMGDHMGGKGMHSGQGMHGGRGCR
ncbi:periplasmic heavy metal sensor [Limnobaculum zhutongyuii]|uniref:Zinc resistance-associated protein n=1 Tax=Limnobaculum zhutongyuii TaxID=2498113 RepID=A0A411WHB6_9GAMM|nr:periplasmic heavy metal sensor [Limnobaculum zhutongyuii]QBH95367.1 periplasmic heavy metal sensor [Limnobaculum zhutongyuii]TQS89015.1 periplasmic heavy metal sensor [Limnobaculum zhutongyuii]